MGLRLRATEDCRRRNHRVVVSVPLLPEPGLVVPFCPGVVVPEVSVPLAVVPEVPAAVPEVSVPAPDPVVPDPCAVTRPDPDVLA